MPYFIGGFNVISLILCIMNSCRCASLAITHDLCALANILLLQVSPQYSGLFFVIHTWSLIAKMGGHVWDFEVDTSIRKYQETRPTQMQDICMCDLSVGYSSGLGGGMSHLHHLVL